MLTRKITTESAANREMFDSGAARRRMEGACCGYEALVTTVRGEWSSRVSFRGVSR